MNLVFNKISDSTFRNYSIELEYLEEEDGNPINVEFLERVTTKAARNAAKKLSTSDLFEELSKKYYEVRVFCMSRESGEYDGVHMFYYKNGECTYETIN